MILRRKANQFHELVGRVTHFGDMVGLRSKLVIRAIRRCETTGAGGVKVR